MPCSQTTRSSLASHTTPSKWSSRLRTANARLRFLRLLDCRIPTDSTPAAGGASCLIVSAERGSARSADLGGLAAQPDEAATTMSPSVSMLIRFVPRSAVTVKPFPSRLTTRSGCGITGRASGGASSGSTTGLVRSSRWSEVIGTGPGRGRTGGGNRRRAGREAGALSRAAAQGHSRTTAPASRRVVARGRRNRP
jgi:hypothetical protein